MQPLPERLVPGAFGAQVLDELAEPFLAAQRDEQRIDLEKPIARESVVLAIPSGGYGLGRDRGDPGVGVCGVRQTGARNVASYAKETPMNSLGRSVASFPSTNRPSNVFGSKRCIPETETKP